MSVTSAQAGHRITVSRGPVWLQMPFIAVIGAMSFNFLLCFVNTNVSGVGNNAIIGFEIAIISTILFYTYPILDYRRFLIIASALLYLLAISATRAVLGDGFDVKPIRDLLIPIAFFMLGAGTSDVRTADTIVRAAVLIVIAVGLFEYLLPDIFTRFFNIARFYIERGSMDAAQAKQSSSLFLSGMRPEGAGGGRNLLPFLGDHRVSSIFLEPVSAGNFGIIVFMWALVRSLATRKAYWGLFASALLIVVLSDSRFGAYFCIISLVLALLPAAIRSVMGVLLPVLGILCLIVLPDLLPIHYGAENGFIGRVIISGKIMGQFDALNWLGLRTPGFFTLDSGYANVIGGIGIAGLIMFWTMLLSIRGRGEKFDLFRSLVGAYFALLLCISNSPFTIKTGSLLWFLAGVLSCWGVVGSRSYVRRDVGSTSRPARPLFEADNVRNPHFVP